MTEVYAIAGAKGGVGKTTTSINLGTVLAELDRRVVTMELDLAMANLVDFLDFDADFETATTLHDVLAGRAELGEATYETDSGLTVVPSGTDLEGYADTDLERLPAIIEQLRWEYDAVLLDTPAGLSEETLRPMQLSDRAIIISTPRVSSVRNAQNTIRLAERTETDVFGLVLTKSGTGASPGAMRIAEFLDIDLLGHVPEDEAVPHAQDSGTPVVRSAPQSGAAIAYRKIARKLGDAETDEGETGRDTAVETELDKVATSQTDRSGAITAEPTRSTPDSRRQMDHTRPEATGDPLQGSTDDVSTEDNDTDESAAHDDGREDNASEADADRATDRVGRQAVDDDHGSDVAGKRSIADRFRSLIGL
ncbi:P-loop NTPase [Halapricum desulfuricans]|uniref:FleN family ATPase involved in flagellar biosynthesis n=1 Tax=Halapricum desulfuricans TaxID=2841257 RepID=A0A897N580_9EURY|nr:P-loop NTPase [Halapricum desulfuricans]QSG06065.1 FleN family ATPase involved in flagellar biosynthesis [Halapricum desulfuricans]